VSHFRPRKWCTIHPMPGASNECRDEKVFIAGACVEVHGLVSEEGRQLNGQRGWLLERTARTNRWRVSISGAGKDEFIKQVKEENLSVVAMTSTFQGCFPRGIVRHFYDAFDASDWAVHGLSRLLNSLSFAGDRFTCLVWCADHHEAAQVSEHLNANIYKLAAAWKVATGQDRRPASYLVVSDDHPPAGAHVDVLINFRAPAVATYRDRIGMLLLTSSSHIHVVTLAASSLASTNEEIKWHHIPSKEILPKLPAGVQRMLVAKPSMFVGHTPGFDHPAALSFQENLNWFEKPRELSAIEKAGVFFQQLGDWWLFQFPLPLPLAHQPQGRRTRGSASLQYQSLYHARQVWCNPSLCSCLRLSPAWSLFCSLSLSLSPPPSLSISVCTHYVIMLFPSKRDLQMIPLYGGSTC